MYINKIDDLINAIIDDFYNNIIITNKKLHNILTEVNFVKYQLDINNILSEYIKKLNLVDIKKTVLDVNNVTHIVNIIKRYISYYIFLSIGYFYDGKNDTYINNIIEFSKNQPTFKFKVPNLFNSENNAKIIKYYILIKHMVLLLSLDSTKLKVAAKNKEYVKSIEYLNTLGGDFINKNLKLENISGNKKMHAHNIIKTIILNELYYKEDKQLVHEILTESEKKEGEYTYIDIIIPKTSYIDYNSIEDIMTENETYMGYANELYDFIMKNDEMVMTSELSVEDKILELIKKKIIIPVVDDFLLYHKDTERYEKASSYEENKYKKKEDTKIRYIIGKIDNVAEYYSENTKRNPQLKKDIEKKFYQPLINRKAILINNYEELKIINKLHNQGKRSIENNEFYNDLMNYRLYPYVNFKDIKGTGFSLYLHDMNTIDIVRSTTFINKKDTNTVQLRTGGNNQVINIVGFMVPSNKMPLNNIKVKKIIDIRDIGKSKKYQNGYYSILKYLNYTLFSGRKHKSSVLWEFDESKDKVKFDSYKQTSKLNENENFKLIISHLYDDILNKIYGSILNFYDKFSDLTFYDSYKILRSHESSIIDIPKNNDLYSDLEKVIFYDKSYKTGDIYDKKEDHFPGLFGDIIELPEIKEENNDDIIKIDLDVNLITTDEKEIVQSEAEKMNAICQHFITWDNIMAIRKKNPNKYTDIMYEFMNQYVIEDNENNYICKSCSTRLNIKKYIIGGYFDKENETFITFNMPMSVPLEDIPQYEKYRLTIRNIDKLIEKMASITSILFYVGNTVSIKSRRKNLVKDTIDLLLIHNKQIRKYYKKRHENDIAYYGINKNFSNMFIFELDNSIFTYSSKDKDTYKNVKMNNIVIYIMFILLLEINMSQLFHLNNDKACNFYWYEKYGNYLFDDMKIIFNDNGDTVNIKKYPILCYLIFYITCLVTKYKMWYYKSDGDKMNKKKVIPMIHKIIVHTFIDVLNSILEVNKKKEKHYIYTLLSNKLFLFMNNFYKDDDIIEKVRDSTKNKIGYISKSVNKLEGSSTIQIGNYKRMKLDVNDFEKCNVSHHYPKLRKDMSFEYSNINYATNCLDGNFHKWKPKNGIFVCDLCNKNSETVQRAESSEIKKIIKYNKMYELAQKFCKSGKYHQFNKNSKTCENCKYTLGEKINEKTLIEISEIINKKKSINDNIIDKSKNGKIESIINNLKNRYRNVNNKNKFQYINNFIKIIQNTIGKDININGNNTYIKHNTYIIDHNHIGQKLNNPIIIRDESKIIKKLNHPFFKRDVVYYTNYNTNINVFYDSATYNLLGYKENNKQFINIENTKSYIKVNESIENMIKIMGFTNTNINIKNQVNALKVYYPNKDDKEKMIKSIVSDIIIERIDKLKRLISHIQRSIYRIIYNDISDTEDTNNIIYKYINKLKNIKIKDNTTKIFKYWYIIYNNMFIDSLENRTINISYDSTYIDSFIINEYDETGNIILFYILEELSKLIDINSNKFTKSTLVYLLLDIIQHVYKSYNNDNMMNNFDIKRFKYVIESNRFLLDVTQKGHGIDETLENEKSEEQKEADREAKLDEIEENNALDAEDNESDYDSE